MPLGVVGLSHLSPLAPGTLGIGQIQSFQPPDILGTGGTQVISAPKYPWDRRYCHFSPQVPLGLEGLSHFSPQVRLGLAGLSHFTTQAPLGLTGLSHFSPQVSLGLAGLSHFSPQVPWGLGPPK